VIHHCKQWCKKIEQLIRLVLQGKHTKTKMQFVLDLLCNGLLFQSEGTSIINMMNHEFVEDVFRPWRLVKAADTAPAGSF